MKPRIIVHGGAGECHDDGDKIRADVIHACEKGYEALRAKGAIDAVETAIIQMEDSPYLNAGVGSYLQLDGTVRMDASVMKDDLSAGAVIGIEDVEHPISVARRVMESTQHIILAGKLATEFARSEGFQRYDPRTRNKVDLWLDIMEEFRTKTSHEQIFHIDRYLKEGKHSLGTVGCVAFDSRGRISVGTSTGGRRMNVPGRVGDSPIPGAGTYCSRFGGVSCTGVGEKILVLCLAKEVVNYIKFNESKTAQDAAEYGIELLDGINGQGGLICVDYRGNIGYAYNTACMNVHSIL